MTAKKWNASAPFYHLFRKNPLSWLIHQRETRAALRLLAQADVAVTSCTLDLGCGRGDSLVLTKAFAERFAVDFSTEMVARTSQAFPSVHSRVADARHLPLEGAFFDLITCIGVCEYIEDIGPVLIECSRVLKKGGALLVSTSPNGLALAARRMLGHPIFVHSKSSLEKSANTSKLRVVASKETATQLLFLLVKE